MGELVQLPSAANGGAFDGKVLTFVVSDEVLALGIKDVKEIIEYSGVTRVPMVGRQLRGVLNLRGRIVPVIDLAARLELPGGADGRRACIVVVDVHSGDEGMEIGIMVDAVNQVVTVDPMEMQPAPSFGARIRDDFIVSMARIAGQFVVILDQSALLSVDEIAEALACT